MNYKELEEYHESRVEASREKVFISRWLMLGVCILLIILCVAAYVYGKTA